MRSEIEEIKKIAREESLENNKELLDRWSYQMMREDLQGELPVDHVETLERMESKIEDLQVQKLRQERLLLEERVAELGRTKQNFFQSVRLARVTLSTGAQVLAGHVSRLCRCKGVRPRCVARAVAAPTSGGDAIRAAKAREHAQAAALG